MRIKIEQKLESDQQGQPRVLVYNAPDPGIYDVSLLFQLEAYKFRSSWVEPINWRNIGHCYV